MKRKLLTTNKERLLPETALTIGLYDGDAMCWKWGRSWIFIQYSDKFKGSHFFNNTEHADNKNLPVAYSTVLGLLLARIVRNEST